MAGVRLDLRNFSFGATSALVTSMGLIVGLNAATIAKPALIGTLLIIGLADNLTDSLSVHIYQEAERLDQRRALRTTITNFFVRLLVAISFVALQLALPAGDATAASLAWGFVLLAALTYALARTRQVNPVSEIAKHVGVGVVVIAISKLVGDAIPSIVALF